MAVKTLSMGARWLKRGDTRDPEDHRLSHRLSVALSILRSQGVEATFPEHEESCILHPSHTGNRIAGWSYRCACSRGNAPEATWPEWVTDEMFERAYALADELQTRRGEWNRVEASRLHAEAEERRRAEGPHAVPVLGPPECPACGGEGTSLGQLGRRAWFRCRNCGTDFNVQEGR